MASGAKGRRFDSCSAHPVRRVLIAPLLAFLGACPGDHSALPSQLWVALNQTEGSIKLTDVEPEPF